MRRNLLVLSVSGLLLVACGGASAGTSGIQPDTKPDTTGTQAAKPAEPSVTEPAGNDAGSGTPDTVAQAPAPEALQFTAPMVGGGEIDFTRYAGQTVALWFWAPT